MTAAIGVVRRNQESVALHPCRFLCIHCTLLACAQSAISLCHSADPTVARGIRGHDTRLGG